MAFQAQTPTRASEVKGYMNPTYEDNQYAAGPLSPARFSMVSNASVASTMMTGSGDEYSFYRVWLHEEALKDPEVAAVLAQWEAQGLMSPRVSPQSPRISAVPPWVQGDAALGLNSPRSPRTSQLSRVAPWSQQQQQQQIAVPHSPSGSQPHQHRRTEPDLREQIARHRATSSPAAGPAVTALPDTSAPTSLKPGQQQQQQLSIVASSSKGGSTGSNSSRGSSKSSGSPATKPDFSRSQIKALRKLFPIKAPALKPAAALQGEYQLLDIIGKGAFGCAYKARQLSSGKLVCIKSMEASAGGSQQAELSKQRREVAVLAALARHPNIIKYHECFAGEASDSGKLHLVMEWADGGDLASLIQRHAKARMYMSEDEILGYFVQLVAAMAHMHCAGIMHRDIKANNVFMTSSGLLKLGDFGISKVLDAPGRSTNGSKPSSHTGLGSIGGGSGAISSNSNSGSGYGASANYSRGLLAHSFVGTPNYLAPETVACEAYGLKADVWAAGCVLYEMAALKPAFRAKHIPMVYHLIRKGKTSPLPPVFSKELEQLQRRMMARDPNERPSSLDLIQDELLRPHFARYHTMLQQLNLELPPLFVDLPLPSISGALHTAALLKGVGALSSSAEDFFIPAEQHAVSRHADDNVVMHAAAAESSTHPYNVTHQPRQQQQQPLPLLLQPPLPEPQQQQQQQQQQHITDPTCSTQVSQIKSDSTHGSPARTSSGPVQPGVRRLAHQDSKMEAARPRALHISVLPYLPDPPAPAAAAAAAATAAPSPPPAAAAPDQGHVHEETTELEVNPRSSGSDPDASSIELECSSSRTGAAMPDAADWPLPQPLHALLMQAVQLPHQEAASTTQQPIANANADKPGLLRKLHRAVTALWGQRADDYSGTSSINSKGKTWLGQPVQQSKTSTPWQDDPTSFQEPDSNDFSIPAVRQGSGTSAQDPVNWVINVSHRWSDLLENTALSSLDPADVFLLQEGEAWEVASTGDSGSIKKRAANSNGCHSSCEQQQHPRTALHTTNSAMTSQQQLPQAGFKSRHSTAKPSSNRQQQAGASEEAGLQQEAVDGHVAAAAAAAAPAGQLGPEQELHMKNLAAIVAARQQLDASLSTISERSEGSTTSQQLDSSFSSRGAPSEVTFHSPRPQSNRSSIDGPWWGANSKTSSKDSTKQASSPLAEPQRAGAMVADVVASKLVSKGAPVLCEGNWHGVFGSVASLTGAARSSSSSADCQESDDACAAALDDGVLGGHSTAGQEMADAADRSLKEEQLAVLAAIHKLRKRLNIGSVWIEVCT